jgi:hypothetical protein
LILIGFHERKNMNLETYKKEKKEMEARLHELDRKYALSNSPVQVGDMVYADYGETIKCDEIGIYLSKPPTCIYWGTMHTKKGAPYKTGAKGSIYQERLNKEKHGLK